MKLAKRLSVSGCVLLSTWLSLWPQSASADGVVTSDFVFRLDNSIFRSSEFDLSPLLSGQGEFALPDMEVAAQVPVSLSGLSVAAAWRLETPIKTISLGADIPVASSELDVRVVIRKLSVDAMVEQEVGGVIVRARVLGSCEDIPLSLNNSARVSAMVRTGIDAQGLPTIELAQTRVEWAAGAWRVGGFACSLGGESFRSRVVAGLESYLAAPSSALNDELRSLFASRLQAYQATLRQWFLQPRDLRTGMKGVSLRLRPQAVAALVPGGFLLKGEIDIQLSSQVSVPGARVPGAGALPLQGSGYSLSLPLELPTALSTMAYRLGLARLRLQGTDVPAFQEFLGNPFLKLFIWPQLLVYSPQDPFYFDFSAHRPPSLGTPVNSQTGVSGQVAADLEMMTWAPPEPDAGSGGFVKMVRFAVPLTTTYRLQLQAHADGSSQATLSFAKVSAGLEAEWQPEYYSRIFNSYIAQDVLRDQLTEWMQGKEFSWRVPPLELTSSLRLGARNVRREGGWLTLDTFKLVP